MKVSVFLWLSLSIALRAQNSPDPQDLLIRSDGDAFNAKTMHLAGTRSFESANDATTTRTVSSFNFESQNDGKTREEIQLGKSSTLTVFDGTSLWRYPEGGKTYTKVAAVRPPATQFGLENLDYGRRPQNIVAAKIDGEEQLILGGNQIPCYIVAASYQALPGNARAQDVTRRVWISKDRNLVLRDSWAYKISTATAATMYTNLVNYTTIEWDTPLSADLFRFDPPAGTEMARTFTPPALPAGNGTGAVAPNPSVLRRVEPEYTPEARAAGLQGTVWVFAEVDDHGKPSDVEVQYGLGLGLDEKAVEAVKQWEFEPVPVPSNGKPIKKGQIVSIDFRLQGAGSWRIRLPRYVRFTQYVAPDPTACPAARSGFINVAFGSDGTAQPVKPAALGDTLNEGMEKALSSWRFRVSFPKGKAPAQPSEIYFKCVPPPGAITASATVPRVGGGVSAPAPVYTPEPGYAEDARKARLQGTVLLSIVVGPDGLAHSIHVTKPLGLGLDEKAVEAVSTWRFRPGMKDGQPVAVQATVEVAFRLL